MTKAFTAEYLQSIVDGVSDPIMVIAGDFTVRFMNEAAKAVSSCGGLSADTRRFCYEVSHGRTEPCGSAGEPCPVGEAFNTGKPAGIFHYHLDNGNKQTILEVSASPLFNETGDVTGVVELMRDVTERKRVENALKESRRELLRKHEKLTTIFALVETGKNEWEKTMDCVSDMVLLTDKEGKIKRCNKSLKEFTGRPYTGLLGREWKELLAEHGLRESACSGEKTESFHSASQRWFIINSYPFKGMNDTDELSGAVITLHDTTELKRVTRELEQTNREINENRNKLQSALDEIFSLIRQATRGKTFSIRFANPNLEKCYIVMGCANEDCACHGKEAMRCWQMTDTLCKSEADVVFKRKYGDCRECPVFKRATPDLVFQIGEQFNDMMRILEMKNRKLAQAYDELKATQAKILQQEKMASIGQLAAGVAHEINNPMGFISSNVATLGKYTERLAEYINAQQEAVASCASVETKKALQDAWNRLKLDYITEDIKKLIAESLDGATRVKTIVQDLKNFSRVGEAEAKLADINECLDTTINIVWNELKYKATLKKDYGKLPLTVCWPQQLNQVFMNLLVNAAQAIESHGEITVRTWEENGSIFIAVTDTGCGIPEKSLSKIFEPFFTTKEVGKGTGLGLSITYDIVKKHHGEIIVQSEVGKGTIFTVRIPAVQED
jgi:two-component system NtrC family sensor kinase